MTAPTRHDIDPDLVSTLNTLADKYGRAGVILAAASLWPVAAEHMDARRRLATYPANEPMPDDDLDVPTVWYTPTVTPGVPHLTRLARLLGRGRA